MLQIFVSVLLVAAAVIGWRLVTARKKAPALAVARRESRSSYHCVEVHGGNHACAAARNLETLRFLSGDAPSLPVPGCSAQACSCSFIHHDDRREDARRQIYGEWAAIPPELTGERRARTERRKSREDMFRPTMAH